MNTFMTFFENEDKLFNRNKNRIILFFKSHRSLKHAASKYQLAEAVPPVIGG